MKINDGEAIGINTLKVTAGISFAIPSDYAQQFLDKANNIEKRSASKSWLSGGKTAPANVQPNRANRYMGIRMLTLTPEILLELKSLVIEEIPDVSHGVMVVGVIQGSPASSGGLKPGDVITKINNISISSSSDVYKAVDTYPEMTLQIHRGRQTLVLKIKPEDAES